MDRQRLWLLLPAPVRRLPADLAAVLALVGLTNLAVFLPVVRETPLRVVVGLAFVLFVPGYAFIAALFPERGDPPTPAADAEPPEPTGRDDSAADEPADVTDPEAPVSSTDADSSGRPDGRLANLGDRGIDGIERVALSFGLSIAIVPLIGLGLNFTSFGIRLVPIVASISAFTVAATVVATLRRWALPPADRFTVPYRSWLGTARSGLLEPSSRVDAALNVLLVLAILLAVSSVVYAVAVPRQGEQFSEFYVLTENEDGELVAADYPTTLVGGEPRSIHVGVGNNEHETVEYLVVVHLQRVAIADNETTVLDRTRLDRYGVTLPHNETAIRERDLAVSDATARRFEGSDRRLVFLLYRDDAPTTPSVETAYRSLHLWVDVRPDGGE